MAISGSDVYVGGYFNSAGEIFARSIARWDGNQWYRLGSDTGNGLDKRVHAIAISGSDVYVGGNFTKAGGIQANHIARWDGTQWHSLSSDSGNGVNNTVSAI